MINKILKRILIMIPTFIGITVITFALMRLAPGDPAMIRAQESAGKVDARAAAMIVADWRQEFELDKPLWKQYANWLSRSARLDFGKSYRTGRPVSKMILSALPITIVLNLFAFVIVYILALPIGVYSAMKPRGTIDKVSSFFFLLIYSLPSFWVAVMLLLLLGSADYLNILPISGFASPDVSLLPWYGKIQNVMWHMILPSFCLAYAGWAFMSRFTKSSFQDVMDKDYIRTAHAKGCSNLRVVWKHAFRNAAIPFVTIFGGMIPAMISGSVIIEKIFSLPGMGMLMFDSVLTRDYPLAMAITTLGAVLVLIGLLISDILYTVVDPRLRRNSDVA